MRAFFACLAARRSVHLHQSLKAVRVSMSCEVLTAARRASFALAQSVSFMVRYVLCASFTSALVRASRGASLISVWGASLSSAGSLHGVIAMRALYAALCAELRVSLRRPPWRLLRYVRAPLPNTRSGRCVAWHVKCTECGGCPASADTSLRSMLLRRCLLGLCPRVRARWAHVHWIRGRWPSKRASLGSLFLSVDGPTGPGTHCSLPISRRLVRRADVPAAPASPRGVVEDGRAAPASNGGGGDVGEAEAARAWPRSPTRASLLSALPSWPAPVSRRRDLPLAARTRSGGRRLRVTGERSGGLHLDVRRGGGGLLVAVKWPSKALSLSMFVSWSGSLASSSSCSVVASSVVGVIRSCRLVLEGI